MLQSFLRENSTTTSYNNFAIPKISGGCGPGQGWTNRGGAWA